MVTVDKSGSRDISNRSAAGTFILLLIMMVSLTSCTKMDYYAYLDDEYPPVKQIIVIDDPDDLPKDCVLFGRLKAQGGGPFGSNLRGKLIKEAKRRGADIISFGDLREIKVPTSSLSARLSGKIDFRYRKEKLLYAYLLKCDPSDQ